MRILLTNDDGINARGLDLLETIAQQFSDDIWVVAPTEEQSGAGHSLTLTQPVRVRRHDDRRFSVTGTPTDAVMMALAHIMKDSPPDLILSGINRGANLAEDVTYSGTVSAAMEGALAGVRSIALSQAYSREGMGDTVPFAAAEAWAERALAPLHGLGHGAGQPDQRQLSRASAGGSEGHPRLPPGHSRLRPPADRRTTRTRAATIISGSDSAPVVETPGHSTDLEVIADGYVSVTPLHLDLTHDASLEQLRERFA